MSDQEEILPCVICKLPHQQMLMLSCMHDPCINCAAIGFCTNKHNNSNVYVCSICGDQTDLDQSSVITLGQLYSSLKKKKQRPGSVTSGNVYTQLGNSMYPVMTEYNNKYQIPNNNKYDIPITNKYTNPTTNRSSSSSKLNNNSNSWNPNNGYNIPAFIMCSTHPQQQLTYFCFTCTCPICPQCAIHGVHRDHQVETTRKAIKRLKNNLNRSQDRIASQVQSNMRKVDSINQQIKQISNQCKKDRQLIANTFNSLQNLLNKKQQQFTRMIDHIHMNNTSMLKSQIQTYRNFITMCSKTKGNIDNILKSPDINILSQYQNSQKQVQATLINNPNTNNNLNIQMKIVNHQQFKDQFQQLINIIGGLKLTTQSTSNIHRK